MKDIIQNAIDLLKKDDPPEQRFLVIPAADYDDPRSKKLYESTFPGVKLIRGDVARGQLSPEASAGNEYWTETEENLK